MRRLLIPVLLFSGLAGAEDLKVGITFKADIAVVEFVCAPGSRPEVTVTTKRRLTKNSRVATASGLLFLDSEVIILTEECPSEPMRFKVLLDRK